MADDIIKSAIESYVNRLSISERDISVLQKENEIQARIFIKFETTIEKIQDLTESMHRLISIHDERIKFQEKIADDLKNTASSVASKLAETAKNTAISLEQETQSVRAEMKNEMKELEIRLTTKLEDTETRILEKISELQLEWKEEKKDNKNQSSSIDGIKGKLLSYKWFVMGGLIVAGILLGKITAISNLISAIM